MPMKHQIYTEQSVEREFWEIINVKILFSKFLHQIVVFLPLFAS